MAERTGQTYLDALIDEFQHEGVWHVEIYDWSEDRHVTKARPLVELRAPHAARGQCIHVADEFNRFLRERGVAAGLPLVNGRPMLVVPEALGYANRPRGGLSEHTLSIVRSGSEIYSIDWTASQYGYKEFPLIQRLENGSWRRDFWVPLQRSSQRSATAA